MSEEKNKIQHFLSNIFTMLNFEIIEKEDEELDREKLLKLLQMANILTAYKGMFLGDPIEVFKQEDTIKNILFPVGLMFKDKVEKAHAKLTFSTSEEKVSLDKYYLEKSLEYIIEFLLNEAKNIDINYDEKDKTLQIIHDHSNPPTDSATPLMEFLDTKFVYNNEIQYRMGLLIIQQMGMKITFSPNKINIQL